MTYIVKTLEVTLSSAKKHRNRLIKEAIWDRGYRGKQEVDGIVYSRQSLERQSKVPVMVLLN